MKKRYDNEPIKVPRFEEREGFYTTPKRSRMMAKIKGKNTKPEMAFRRALFAAGVRYRADVKGLPGKPDLANKSKKFVVFIDGEFWHGFNWEEKKEKIKSNRKFWIPKIERNMQRDREVNNELCKMGYRVFRFWDFEVKANLGACIKEVLDYLSENE